MKLAKAMSMAPRLCDGRDYVCNLRFCCNFRQHRGTCADSFDERFKPGAGNDAAQGIRD